MSAFEAAYDRIDGFCQWLVEGEVLPSPPESTELDLIQTLHAADEHGPLFDSDREPASVDHRELCADDWPGRALRPPVRSR